VDFLARARGRGWGRLEQLFLVLGAPDALHVFISVGIDKLRSHDCSPGP